MWFFFVCVAANAEDIRTKEHKDKSASRHTGMDLRPCALKDRRGYAVTTLSVINKAAIALNATA